MKWGPRDVSINKDTAKIKVKKLGKVPVQVLYRLLFKFKIIFCHMSCNEWEN